MLRKFASLWLILFLTACQAIPLFRGSPTSTSVPSPTPFPEKYIGAIQVGLNKLYIFCEGKGEPTIILENGLSFTSWNDNSLARFKTITRTCRYFRVGVLGEPINGPRTTMDQVQDLHSLLTQAGVPGPYILVGHSIAGYNLVLYTRQYPQDVAGLVCVDCRYPAVRQIFIKKLDSQNPNDTAAIVEARNGENVSKEDWKQNVEHLDIPTSDQQVLKETSLGNRPFIVLVAGSSKIYYLDKNIQQLFNESWMEASQQLSKLSTRGQIKVVPNEDHNSILRNAMIDSAVQQVYSATNKP